MSDIPYVSAAAALLTTEWERRFQELPKEAGIIFASVKPRPAPGGVVKDIDVRLGIDRTRSEDTVTALAKHVLRAELESELYNIRITVVAGVPGRGAHAALGHLPS